MKPRETIICVALFALTTTVISAQQPTPQVAEQRAPLTEAAIALDSKGAPVLEGSLRTTAVSGTVADPLTDVRFVLKNVSSISFDYLSGLVSFYDNAGIRCGEGVFKADVLAVNESVETDAPGIRIRCAPNTWRLVTTSLVTHNTASNLSTAAQNGNRPNLVISVDGEEHPIQLDKPMTLNLGEKKRTIVIRQVP